MKKIMTLLVLGLILSGCDQKSETFDMSFTYTGVDWHKYNDHRVEIVVMDTTVAGTKPVVDKFVIKDGKFQVSDTLQYFRNAYLGLYDPDGQFVYKQEFVLEPGKLEFSLKEDARKADISGGHYNKLIHGDLMADGEYQKRTKVLEDFTKSLSQEDFKIDSIRQKYLKLSNAIRDYGRQYYQDVFGNGQDSVAQLLVFNKLGYTDEIEPEIDVLERKFGAGHPEVYLLRRTYKTIRESRQMSNTVNVGSTIKNFRSKDLNGTEFQLSDVLENNKYVLVEFWASWCGPCRAEIPHMKRAYGNFHDKGFEIVSFTLDHERKRWVKASDEENLPWVNVGDLLAYKSPVTKMYGIRGIPANFLVDKTGTIIERDLRQEKLDHKLEELFAE